MNKREYIILITMIIFLLLLGGCSKKQTIDNSYTSTVSEDELSASSTIQKLTKESIIDRYKEADSISLEDYDSIDDVSYLAFSYKNKKKLYYGFTVATKDNDKWKLSYFEDYPNDSEESVVITQFIGSYPGTEDQKVHITAGYINDKDISQVILYYPESKVDIINLGENQHVFFDININSDDSLLKIECRSSDEKVLYTNEFTKG